MSAIKNPEAKKQVSLERDRRNTYGENSKSSRKNVKLGKQRRHMDERRTVGEVLGRLRGCVQEDEATDAELLAKTRIIDSKRRGFKKKPDTPLGIVLPNKKSSEKSNLGHSRSRVEVRFDHQRPEDPRGWCFPSRWRRAGQSWRRDHSRNFRKAAPR